MLVDEAPHQRRQQQPLRGGRRTGVTGSGGRLGSDRLGSDRLGSDRLDSDRLDSDRLDSDRLGSDRRGGSGVAEHGQDGANVDRLALGHADLEHHATRGRGHLGVDLVGRHLEERLVLGDGVAHLLEPSGDGALGHRLTQLRHHDLGHRFLVVLVSFVHVLVGGQCSDLPVRESTVSPNNSLMVGCG